MVLAEVEDGAGQQEEGGARGRGRGGLQLALLPSPAPRGSILLLTLACEVPWAQDPTLVFPLSPRSTVPVPSPLRSERMVHELEWLAPSAVKLSTVQERNGIKPTASPHLTHNDTTSCQGLPLSLTLAASLHTFLGSPL